MTVVNIELDSLDAICGEFWLRAVADKVPPAAQERLRRVQESIEQALYQPDIWGAGAGPAVPEDWQEPELREAYGR